MIYQPRGADCSGIEMLHISLPNSILSLGTTCGDHLAPWIMAMGGYVVNPDAHANCLYCPASDTNAAILNLGLFMETRRAWRNIGFMAAYVVFYILAVFAIYGSRVYLRYFSIRSVNIKNAEKQRSKCDQLWARKIYSLTGYN